MNKKGAFLWPRSFWFLFFSLIFLYLGLMPFFDVFPYNFELGENILRILIVAVGVLVFIESFKRDRGFKRILQIIVGAVVAAFGVYIFLMGINVSVPFVFGINKIVLQVILILYSLYLLWGAFKQERSILGPP